MRNGSGRWLRPGMRIKRWVGLIGIGLCVAALGIAFLNHAHPVDILSPANRLLHWIGRRGGLALVEGEGATGLGVLFTLLGLSLVGFAVTRLLHSITSALNPGGSPESLVDAVYRNRYLAQGPRVVVIGGGTGLSTMLRGLKEFTSNIVAVVTVTDDGGSSGRLQKQLNILPPGDIV